MNRNTRIQKGFTLIELMVTIAIGAILVGVGAPALKSYLVNSQLTAKTNGLVAGLNLARGQAIAEGDRLGVMISAGEPVYNGSAWSLGGNWDDGWTVWRDKDGDGSLDVNYADLSASDHEILRSADGHPNVDISVTQTVDNTAITSLNYLPSGRISLSSAVQITVCNADAKYGRLITITRTGRVALENARYTGC